MYWSGAYWGRVYWPTGYWGWRADGLVDCSDGPYVVAGYWALGYAQCDQIGYEVTLVGGRRASGRGKRRDDYDEARARRDAWDAIEHARQADQHRREAFRPPPVASPETTTLTVTAEGLAAIAGVETDERKRKNLLALLLILTEV